MGRPVTFSCFDRMRLAVVEAAFPSCSSGICASLGLTLMLLFSSLFFPLRTLQHEIAWEANTLVGHGSYCSRALDPPNCVQPLVDPTAAVLCCDPRFQARFFPVDKSRAALDAIRGIITGLTAVLCKCRSALVCVCVCVCGCVCVWVCVCVCACTCAHLC